MGIKLYETEWLCYVEEIDGRCTYWVIRLGGENGVSPLYTKHKVKKRHVMTAVTLFQNHPDGIQALKPDEFNKKMRYKIGSNWSPDAAIENKAESVILTK